MPVSVVHSENALLHKPKEILGGVLRDALECPERVVRVLEALYNNDLFHVISCEDIVSRDILDDIIKIVHGEKYLTYLQTIHGAWKAAGGSDYVIPECFPKNRATYQMPKDTFALPGWFSFDLSSCITEHTWESVYSSAMCAVSGAEKLLSGDNDVVFSLCRPPGHHCESELAGGYCYLNNAAIATTHILQKTGYEKHVSILDLDFHHGNGTQSIFYSQANPGYISLHGQDEYPYYTGSSNEIGKDEGQDFNFNNPLPKATDDTDYLRTLEKACNRVKKWNSEILIVSFGTDTFELDPIGGFKLTKDVYRKMGIMLGLLGIKVLVLLEGGYHVDSIGHLVRELLLGIHEGMT